MTIQEMKEQIAASLAVPPPYKTGDPLFEIITPSIACWIQSEELLNKFEAQLQAGEKVPDEYIEFKRINGCL